MSLFPDVAREKAIDVLWALVITSLPVGPERDNTPEERRAALEMLAAVSGSLMTLGVGIEELKAAQQRWRQAAVST